MVKPSGHFKGGTSLSIKVYAECGDYIAIGIERVLSGMIKQKTVSGIGIKGLSEDEVGLGQM